MNDHAHVHLLFCTDATFLQHTTVSLVSVLANNPDPFFDVVIAWRRGPKPFAQHKVRRSLEAFTNVALTFHEFSPPPNLRLPIEAGAHHTIDAYTRLWVGEFFPREVNRVLYLDGDVLAVGEIAPLWNTDLSGKLLAAVDVPGSERTMARLGMCPKHDYFNAGVLLIDLARWRESGALDAVVQCIATKGALLRHDQDAMNICFHNRRKPLEYEWNGMWPFFYPAFYETPLLPLPRTEIDTVRRSARIIHFNGPTKPWGYLCDHPRRGEYKRYLRMTEWRGCVPADRTLRTRVQKVTKRARMVASLALPQSAKDFLKGIAKGVHVL